MDEEFKHEDREVGAKVAKNLLKTSTMGLA